MPARRGEPRSPLIRRLRIELTRSQRGLCYWCRIPIREPDRSGQRPDMATLDHITPFSKGGATTEANCVAACYACNQARRDSGGIPPTLMRKADGTLLQPRHD